MACGPGFPPAAPRPAPAASPRLSSPVRTWAPSRQASLAQGPCEAGGGGRGWALRQRHMEEPPRGVLPGVWAETQDCRGGWSRGARAQTRTRLLAEPCFPAEQRLWASCDRGPLAEQLLQAWGAQAELAKPPPARDLDSGPRGPCVPAESLNAASHCALAPPPGTGRPPSHRPGLQPWALPTGSMCCKGMKPGQNARLGACHIYGGRGGLSATASPCAGPLGTVSVSSVLPHMCPGHSKKLRPKRIQMLTWGPQPP